MKNSESFPSGLILSTILQGINLCVFFPWNHALKFYSNEKFVQILSVLNVNVIAILYFFCFRPIRKISLIVLSYHNLFMILIFRFFILKHSNIYNMTVFFSLEWCAKILIQTKKSCANYICINIIEVYSFFSKEKKIS